MSEPADRYTHGHHAAVVANHATRTAEDCAAFLLPHVAADWRLLDVGCGPGSITVGLAEAVPRGRVVAIDNAGAIVEQARGRFAEAGLTNVEARVESVYALPDPDDSYDATYAHQVLQHLSDPVAAFREMARVTRPGGFVAVRDADYHGMFWAPRSPELDRWMELYQAAARANSSAEPDAGRYLAAWARAAGLEVVEVAARCWVYADLERRRFWGGTWAQRTAETAFGQQAIELGLTDQAELDAIAEAWRAWAEHPDGFFCVTNVECLARPGS